MITPKPVYLFLGPPGSGKGTLSHLCVKKLGWTQLSTGNLCRKHVSDGTELGQRMDLLLKSGMLIDDRLISQMVFEWFLEKNDQDNTIILDGYPRTLVQAQIFDQMIQEQGVPIEIRVVRFRISEQVVISRICGRLICEDKECQQVYSTLSGSLQAPQQLSVCDVCKGPLGKRTDDTESSVRERLKIYFQHEKGMLDFYKHKGYSIEEFSAEQQAPEVFEQFKKLIGTPIK